jgi:tagatose-1,6-bisphosphate aldolase non-catalytic subunit AgaZ/GatZ
MSGGEGETWVRVAGLGGGTKTGTELEFSREVGALGGREVGPRAGRELHLHKVVQERHALVHQNVLAAVHDTHTNADATHTREPAANLMILDLVSYLASRGSTVRIVSGEAMRASNS